MRWMSSYSCLRARQAGLVSLLLALLLSGSSVVSAQQPLEPPVIVDPLVRLTQAQAHAFREGLQTVAEQAHVTFVAEGWPLHSILPSKSVLPLPSTTMPLSQAVEKLATAYDYDVQRQGQVFRLTKRYTDPQDLPGLTLMECQQSLEDVERVTSPFNPHVAEGKMGTRHSIVGELVSSLSWQQLQAMHETTPNKALSIASLNSEQQGMAWNLALYFYVQEPMSSVENALGEVKQAADPKTKLAFRWGEVDNLRVFGYEPYSEAQNQGSFRPLSSPHGQISYRGPLFATLLTPHPVKRSDGTQRLPDDPTDPLPTGTEKTKVQDTEQETNPAATDATLQTVVTHLSAHQDKAVIAVDPALQSKPITVVGEANTTPDEIVQALSAVYGLRIRTRDDGTKVLTRRLFQISNDVSTLPENVRRVLPAPFLRALHSDDSDSLADEYRLYTARSYRDQGEMSEANATALGKVQENLRSQEKQTRVYLSEMRMAAVRQLRTHIEPKFTAALDNRVMLSSLGESDKQALAVVLMAQYLENLRPLLSRHVPEFISTFDQIYLTGGLTATAQGKQSLGLFLSPLTPDGKRTYEQIGMGVPLTFSVLPASNP